MTSAGRSFILIALAAFVLAIFISDPILDGYARLTGGFFGIIGSYYIIVSKIIPNPQIFWIFGFGYLVLMFLGISEIIESS